MICIVKAYDSDENYGHADYAWFEFDEKFVEYLKKLEEVSMPFRSKLGINAYYLAVWNSMPTFFNLDSIDEGDLTDETWGLLENVRETTNVVFFDEMPEDLNAYFEKREEEENAAESLGHSLFGTRTCLRKECGLLKFYIGDSGRFRFDAYVKHTSIKMDTDELTIEQLEDALEEAKNTIPREDVMKDPSVHTLTKEILRLSEDKDIVDRVKDVNLALRVLEGEMRKSLKDNQ